MTPDDMTLLREFATSESGPAFGVLVERYAGLVHSAALRQTGDANLAEEITQAVFIILARKAAKLGRTTILSAWLYRTTRYTASNALKIQRRRQAREQEAYMQSTLQTDDTTAAWQQLAPLLDDTMDQLSERDRAAVVLRYFENRPWREVADRMRMNEDAVQKRVARALEKLRGLFYKRGVMLTASIIAGAVAANSVQAAPMGVIKTISVVAATKGVAATGSTSTLVKGALKLMAWSKAKVAIVVGIVVLMGSSSIIIKEVYFPEEPSFEGRKLSAWMVDVNYNQPEDKRAKARDAIQHMGSKTIPFLLAALSEKSSDDKACQATWAFDALGPLGKSAIPKLERMLTNNPGYVPGALAGIGKDALPALFEALTNQDFFVRDNTAAYLANAVFSGKISAEDASPAFPIAIQNLQYESTNQLFKANTRWRAASLVEALHFNPDVSVPALLKCMEQSMDEADYTVAAGCALALGHFGENARTAIPDMVKNMEKLMDQSTDVGLIACETQFAMALGDFGKSAKIAIPVLFRASISTNDALSQIASQSLKRIQ